MKRPNPDPSSENTQETAPCFACGQQTPLPDDVNSVDFVDYVDFVAM